MAIPDYQSIMLPLLQLIGNQKVISIRDATKALADEFGLTDVEREELLASGKQTIFSNRVAWAKTYLKKANLIDSPKRGQILITQAGLSVLNNPPDKINVAYLKQFPEFLHFFQSPSGNDSNTAAAEEENKTPDELIETAHQELMNTLSAEILQTIKNGSPKFFEDLVIDLLINMGYGGSRTEAGKAIGKSGDEGIDGIIKEDRLGLDTIYLQAKRWENTVHRPEIQKFAGALQGYQAKKGVFITTSNFSSGARDFAAKIDSAVVLIDGKILAKLMIEHNVGVSPVATYEVKKIDSDYFVED